MSVAKSVAKIETPGRKLPLAWTSDPRALPRLGAIAHATLLLAILACLWLPATPLPLGGPNVVLGMALVLSAGLLALTSAASGQGLVVTRPVFWMLGVIGVMLVWACGVTVFTGTFSVPLVGQIAMGAAVLAATWVAVDTPRRALLAATALVVATVISVLFGLAVVYVGDPLWRVWVTFANPEPRFADDVLLGRIAGLSPRVVNLAFQMAVAGPLAVALLLYNPLRDPVKRRVYDVALYALALILCVGVYFNTTRSAALALVAGLALVLALTALAPRAARRALLRRAGILLVALIVGFAAVVAGHQMFGANPLRTLHRQVPAECETSLGNIVGDVEVAGAWDDGCESLVLGERAGRLYTFSVDAPKFVAIELAGDVHPYLYLMENVGRNRDLPHENSENHDGGAGTNARIVDSWMVPGDYTVEVTTMYPGETGDFTLTFTTKCQEESLGVVETAAAAKMRASGWSSACLDISVRRFSFSLAEPLPISVSVHASGLVPNMRLKSLADGVEFSPAVTRRETIGDRARVLRAGFSNLPAGNYQLEVRPMRQNAVGNFTVAVGVPASHAESETQTAPDAPVQTAPETTPDAPAEAKTDATEETEPEAAREAEPNQAPQAAPDAVAETEPDAETAPDASAETANIMWEAPRTVPLIKPEDLAARPQTDRTRLTRLDVQAFDRVYLALTALNYSREYPFGTGGVYAPEARHVDLSWGTRRVQAAFAFTPHNQFLLCLVQYGVPGLVLLLVLYGGVLWVFVHVLRRRESAPVGELWGVFVGLSGALAGYVLNSMFHEHGPFTKDWFHCVLIGLFLAVALRLGAGGDNAQANRAHAEH